MPPEQLLFQHSDDLQAAAFAMDIMFQPMQLIHPRFSTLPPGFPAFHEDPETMATWILNMDEEVLAILQGEYSDPSYDFLPIPLDDIESLLAMLLEEPAEPSDTATDSEIKNSGLEVITSQQLEQYELDGKCVICLAEYQPQDEVRVMSCPHAFHRGCIDYWLEKSQNSCPVCRSTGVPTNMCFPNVSEEEF